MIVYYQSINNLVMKRLNNKLTIFGSAFKYGQPYDGVELTPAIMSAMGLAKNLVMAGNKVRHYGMMYPKIKETTLRTTGLFCANLARKVYLERKDDRRIINIGGDHTVSIGSINGVLEHDPDTIVIILDWHNDMNSHGPLHRIPFAFLTGSADTHDLSKSKYLKPKLKHNQMAYIGIMKHYRDNMPSIEGITCRTADFVEQYGGGAAVEFVLDRLDPLKQKPIFVSLDMTVVDLMHNVESLPYHSISTNQTLEIMDALRKTKRIIGMDMVEINASFDKKNKAIKFGMQCIERLFTQKD
jgi:arginase